MTGLGCIAYTTARDTAPHCGHPECSSQHFAHVPADDIYVRRVRGENVMGYGSEPLAPADIEPMAWVIVGDTATFPGTQAHPVPMRHGDRVFVGLCRSAKDRHHLHAMVKCEPCDRVQRMSLGEWRDNRGKTCRRCAKDRRKAEHQRAVQPTRLKPSERPEAIPMPAWRTG